MWSFGPISIQDTGPCGPLVLQNWGCATTRLHNVLWCEPKGRVYAGVLDSRASWGKALVGSPCPSRGSILAETLSSKCKRYRNPSHFLLQSRHAGIVLNTFSRVVSTRVATHFPSPQPQWSPQRCLGLGSWVLVWSGGARSCRGSLYPKELLAPVGIFAWVNVGCSKRSQPCDCVWSG